MTVVRFLHVLAMVFFVGGQLMLALVVTPAVRRQGTEATMREAARRFGMGSAAALLVPDRHGRRDGVALRPVGRLGVARQARAAGPGLRGARAARGPAADPLALARDAGGVARHRLARPRARPRVRPAGENPAGLG